MSLTVQTPNLEGISEEEQLSEKERAVLNEENSPNSLFKILGKDGIVNAIRKIRLKYQNEADKGYVEKLILRIVGEGSDLNWEAKRYISQGLVTCVSGLNKVEVVRTFSVLAAGVTKSSSKPELKLYCPLQNEYLVLEDFVKYCCSYPEQPIKSVLEIIKKFEYKN